MFRAWLQLIRLPNLFTVPGDPLAGFLLASGALHAGLAELDHRAALAALASFCIYAGGLIHNDLVDFAEDLRDRPKRPLPSGAVPKLAAQIVCLVLLAAGIFIMRFVAGQNGSTAASLLVFAVALYNYWAKRIPVLGALVMGSCRGLSLFLGAVACTGSLLPQSPLVLAAAIGTTLYIAAVTNLARHETEPTVPATARWLPAVPVLGLLILSMQFTGQLMRSLSTTILAVALVVVAVEVTRLFSKKAPPLPPVIGALIRILLPLQAAYCLVYPHGLSAQITGISLLIAAPLARRVGKIFYAS